jgi:hypothetical protein
MKCPCTATEIKFSVLLEQLAYLFHDIWTQVTERAESPHHPFTSILFVLWAIYSSFGSSEVGGRSKKGKVAPVLN